MAITVKSSNPRRLLAEIYKAIDDDLIHDWSYDDVGDLTSKISKWKNLAWMRPRIIDEERLVFNIIAPKLGITREIYAIFHARLVEMILAHFDEDMEYARTTAKPQPSDLV